MNKQLLYLHLREILPLKILFKSLETVYHMHLTSLNNMPLEGSRA